MRVTWLALVVLIGCGFGCGKGGGSSASSTGSGGTSASSTGGTTGSISATWGANPTLEGRLERGQLTLSWSEAQGVAGYVLTQDGVRLAALPVASRTFTVPFPPGLSSEFVVEGRKADGSLTSDGPHATIASPAVELSAVLPAVDPALPMDLAASATALFSGANPLQVGVDVSKMDAPRLAVLRGLAKDREGKPLSGVVVKVAGRPEFGRTATRADGFFDLAANGGERLTLAWERPGFLPVHRAVNAPWSDFATLPEVTLTKLDAAVTTVALGGSAMQVARGTRESDSHGARQVTALVPPGTRAQLELADGTKVDAPELHLRFTEFTVGEQGPSAMPAELPPGTAYTFAAELGADEAMALGAKSVTFDKPLAVYLENFIGFPVGETVPSGFYDREKGAWVPSPNGRVVEVKAIAEGLASLAVEASGAVADAAALAALGITDEERRQVAGLYPVGTKLWRVPVTHFTPYDLNWVPQAPRPDPLDDPNAGRSKDKCACQGGSVIECENQVLGEDLPLAGTPFSLHWSSQRQAGRKVEFTVEVPLRRTALATGLVRTEVRVEVAGQVVTRSFPASSTPATFRWTWDGKDAWGRKVNGPRPARVRVTRHIDGLYQRAPSDVLAFSQASGVSVADLHTLATMGFPRDTTLTLGTVDAVGQGFGGWEFDAHSLHFPLSRELWSGGGARRSAESVKAQPVARIGTDELVGEFGADTDARFLPGIRGSVPLTAAGPDGSVFVTTWEGTRIWKVGRDGKAVVVAGNGNYGPVEEGARALDSSLHSRSDLFGAIALGPKGELHFATRNGRVWKVATDGTLVRVAGPSHAIATPLDPYPDGGFLLPDGGGLFNWEELREALGEPPMVIASSLAFSPTGDLFGCVDNMASRIDPATRRAEPIQASSELGANIPSVPLRGWGGICSAMAFGPDGHLFIASLESARGLQISELGEDGLVRPRVGVADGAPSVPGVEGAAADQVALADLFGFAVASDGSILFAGGFEEPTARGLWRVGDDGRLALVLQEDAVSTPFVVPRRPFFLADGELLLDLYAGGIHSLAIEDLRETSQVRDLPESDGSTVQRFDRATGRHLSTRDERLGIELLRFGYDAAGRLISATDLDGQVTRIERDGAGNPTAVVGPYGHRTTLKLGADGLLAESTNPAGETTKFEYGAGALLTQLTDPRGNLHTFRHDAEGRLLEDVSPDGKKTTLSRTETPTGFKVESRSAMGRTTTYEGTALSGGRERRSTTSPEGLTTTTVSTAWGFSETTAPDGSRSQSQQVSHPRFGMAAAFPAFSTVVLPSGASLTSTSKLEVQRDAQGRYLGETSQQSVGNETWQSTWNLADRTWSSTSPMGRTVTRTLDDHGRVVRVDVPGLESVLTTFDSKGRPETSSRGARTYRAAYDARGDLSRLEAPDQAVIGFERDLVGRVTAETLPDGSRVAFAWDANGNRTSLTPPGQGAHAFRWTSGDQLDQVDPPALGSGATPTRFRWNTDRQLNQVTRPDGHAVDFARNAAGRLTGLTAPGIAFGWQYDTAGRLSEASSGAQTLTYGYDGPLTTHIEWEGLVEASIDHAYDDRLRHSGTTLDGVTVPETWDRDGVLASVGDLTLEHDATNGLRTGSTVAGLSELLTVDGLGEVTAVDHSFQGNAVLAFGYVRDNRGRLIERTETREGVTTTFHFTWDANGRLAAVERDGVAVEQYAWDPNGNRTSSGLPAVAATYDAQDRQLTHGNASFNWTVNGELESKTTAAGVTRYGYDGLGRLVRTELPGGRVVEYVMDSNGRRIAKKVDGQVAAKWVWESQFQPLAEYDDQGNLTSRFVYGTRLNVPDLILRNGTTWRLITDQVGSVRLVVNADTGEVAQEREYDAWGRVLRDTAPGFQPFGFAGGLEDLDTGLVHFGAREYDPETGRWTSKDPVGFGGGSSSVFAYCDGDPLNRYDPTGLTIQFGPDPAHPDPEIEAAFDRASRVDPEGAGKRIQQMKDSAIRFIALDSDLPRGTFGKTTSCGSATTVEIHIDLKQIKSERRSAKDKSRIPTPGEAVAHETEHAVEERINGSRGTRESDEQRAYEAQNEYRNRNGRGDLPSEAYPNPGFIPPKK